MIHPSLDNHNSLTRLRGGQVITWRGAWTGLKPQRTKEGFTEVCCCCKRSKMENGSWQLILNDIFSSTHKFCPKCLKISMQELKSSIASDRERGLVHECIKNLSNLPEGIQTHNKAGLLR